MSNQSYLNEATKKQQKEDEDYVIKAHDLKLALEKFIAKHGETARVGLFFHDEDLGEIIPYQVRDVNDDFYDYERGDVLNIELLQ